MDSFSAEELQRLHDRLRQGIDAAARSVADVLHVAVDALILLACRKPDSGPPITQAEAPPVPRMMTPGQAAAYLGIRAQTLAIWRSTGRYSLPFVKVGRTIRYRKSDLDAFLQRRTANRMGGTDCR